MHQAPAYNQAQHYSPHSISPRAHPGSQGWLLARVLQETAPQRAVPWGLCSKSAGAGAPGRRPFAGRGQPGAPRAGCAHASGATEAPLITGCANRYIWLKAQGTARPTTKKGGGRSDSC
jgi:hypothetical protein